MASHNNSGQGNRNNKINPARKFPLNKTRKNNNIQSPQFTLTHSETTTSTTDTNDLTLSSFFAGSSSSSNHSNSARINDLASNHTHFSLRNSLRTDLYDFSTMGPSRELIFSASQNGKPILEKGVDDTSKYMILNGECFIETFGGFMMCMLCGRKDRLTGPLSIEKHLTSDKHTLNLCRLKSSLLEQTPPESSIQMNALRELLNSWLTKYALTDADIVLRLDVIDEFKAILGRLDPECRCKNIGSFTSGTSLKNSDINLELIHPNYKFFETDTRSKNSFHHKLVDPDADYGQQINYHTLHYDLIPNSVDTLDKLRTNILNFYREYPMDSFEVISELDDLNKKVPKLILRHLASSTRLLVSCYAESSHKLTALLTAYMTLDERARILSILAKYWAEVCDIGRPDKGTYPPETFVILVIYYLQRTSPPVLPCLHEIVFKSSKTATSEFDNANGEKERLGLQALANFIITEKDEKVGSTDNQDNLVEDEELDDEIMEDSVLIDVNNEDVKNLNWVSSNDTPIHMLFINFLGFTMKEFDDLHRVISIRTLKMVPLTSKNWNGTKIKAIENPVKPKTNLSQCIGSFRSFEYIKNCFIQGYFYLTSVPVDMKLKSRDENQPYPQDFIKLYINVDRLGSYYSWREKKIRSNSNDYDPVEEMINQSLFARDVAVINRLFEANGYSRMDIRAFSTAIANFYDLKLLRPSDVNATKFCWLCRKTGHPRSSCPKNKIENLRSELENYDIDLDINSCLDSYFLNCYHKDSISQDLSITHKQVVRKLTGLINSETGLKCRLELFGSTINNLGSIDSDLDICVTLQDNPSGIGVDCVKILQQIHDVLMGVKEIDRVEAIFTARVPILKFRYCGFAVDLSMYNQCAIHNSKLLKTYSTIDKRVAQLFYIVKRYAKACDIANAAQGSLSSYAWSVMVIHYLQRTNPPILPVLQETDAKKPMFGVDGWNVWFNSDIKSLFMIQNVMTLTQLFKGFLLHFGNFEYNRYVISIRKLNPISKFLKNWHHCMMAVEDPFELTYNLSGRLDDPMAIYIMNSFAQAYRHIEHLQKEHLDGSSSFTAKQLFDGRAMTGGSSPPYRGCRWCHKIGHKSGHCPQRAQKINRNDSRSVKNR